MTNVATLTHKNFILEHFEMEAAKTQLEIVVYSRKILDNKTSTN